MYIKRILQIDRDPRSPYQVSENEFIEWLEQRRDNYYPESFQGCSYYACKAPKGGITLYRFYSNVEGGASKHGSYWTADKPAFREGCWRDKHDLAILDEFNNNMKELVIIHVPENVIMYAGIAARQNHLLGGGVQFFLDYEMVGVLIELSEGNKTRGEIEMLKKRIDVLQKEFLKLHNKWQNDR